MDTWTPDGSWVHKDGSILYGQEVRKRGQALKVERYPLILVDETNEVLYGVDARAAVEQQGVKAMKCVRIIAEAQGFPPRGQRHPAAD
jgi:hypothetical protein